MKVDDLDRRILRQLQAEPSLSIAELAERSSLPRATCWRRMEQLQEAGVLRAQRSVIDWERLGYQVAVSLRITVEKSNPRAFDDILEAARAIPEVLEIQTFLGRVDLRLHVLARDMAHYQEIYRDRILRLPHIAEIEALMQVAALKSQDTLPL